MNWKDIGIKRLSFIILAILFFIILLQNTQVTIVHIFFWSYHMSLIILIMITMVLGFGMGYLSHFLVQKRQRKQK